MQPSMKFKIKIRPYPTPGQMDLDNALVILD